MFALDVGEEGLELRFARIESRSRSKSRE